jgi:hypothetical protein
MSPKKVNSKVPEDIPWVSLSGVIFLFVSERLLTTTVDFIAVGCREGGISLCTLVACLACLYFSCCPHRRGQDYSQCRSNQLPVNRIAVCAWRRVANIAGQRDSAIRTKRVLARWRRVGNRGHRRTKCDSASHPRLHV